MKPGTKLGAFEILGRLGAGGMGEVYRARDTILDRDVAIKILPEALAAEPGRLDRLAREARLLASLNHPNIGAIYAVETAGPVHALILEMIDGETLATRLRRKPLSIAEARNLARQMIDALDAAHQCGIIHRDLKPDNIMIGPRGAAKVLDFGIAKTAAPAVDGPTVSGMLTAPGGVVGTPAYMSPEQLRGLQVDRRADIWAFGCVLYEMLTARRAFGGSTMSDTIVATLQGTPDWNALPANTPPGLRRLLRRCLEKDPHDRLRDIADGQPDLDAADPDAQEKAPADIPAAHGWMPWLVAAAAVVAAAWLAVRSPAPPSDDSFSRNTLTLLTTDAGLTTTPALSRDGRLLAYASDRGGEGTLHLWVQQIGGGAPLQITSGEADDTAPDFSPDGSQVVFHSDRADGGVYVVPALGGAAPRLIVANGFEAKYSPDGSRLAYFSGTLRGSLPQTRSQVFVVSLAGGAPLRVAPNFLTARAPVWAPDGKSILFAGRSDGGPIESTFDWWLARLDGSPPIKTGLLQSHAAFRGAEVQPSAWTAGGVIFSDGRDIWRADISPLDGRLSAAPQRLTLSAAGAERPSASADGKIVFASTFNRRVIERVDVRSPPASAPPVPLYADFASNAGRPSQTRDGSVIVFERPAPEGIEIWTRDLRTNNQQVVARVGSRNLLNATISPDGVRISYATGEFGHATGYVIETARGVPARVCENCSLGGFLSDSRRLLMVKDQQTLLVHDVVAGTSERVLRVGQEFVVNRAHVSPDDRWIAFRVNQGPGGKSYVAALTPGRPISREQWREIQEPTISGRPCGWAPDGTMVYLLLDTDGFRCLWGQRIGSDGGLQGHPLAIRHFHEVGASALSTSLGEAISPQGFLYGTLRSSGNIWSLVRQP